MSIEAVAAWRSAVRNLAVGVVACSGLLAFPVVAGATTLSWSSPLPVDLAATHVQAGLACPTVSQCSSVEGDLGGGETTFNPQSPRPAIRAPIGSTVPVASFSAVSCPSATQCTATEGADDGTHRYALTFNPQAPPLTPPTVIAITGGAQLASVACPSTTLCVSVDDAGGVASFDPRSAETTATTSIAAAVPEPILESVACPSVTQCTAVDDTGHARTFNPESLGTPASTMVADNNELLFSVACASATQCTAVDHVGGVVTFNPQLGTVTTPTTTIDNHVLTSVACASATQCTAVDNNGSALTFNPNAPRVPSLPTATTIDSGQELAGVTCPTATQCTAVDGVGGAVTFNPQAPGSPSSTLVDSGDLLTGLACPSLSQCTALDAHGRVGTFNPLSLTSVTTSATSGVTGLHLTEALACPSLTQCTVVDVDGGAVTFDPQAPGSPTRTVIDNNATPNPSAVACPSLTQCTTVDAAGDEVTFNPQALGDAPSPATIDSGHSLSDVACPSTVQCTTVDQDGGRVTFNPTAPSSVLTVQTGKTLTAIACPSSTQCTAGDSAGDVLTFNPQSVASPPAVPVAQALPRIACPSLNVCVAPSVQVVGGIGVGGTAAQGDPLSSAAWTLQPLTTVPTTVSCPAVDECVIVDQTGSEVTGTVPAAAPVPPVAAPVVPAPPAVAPVILAPPAPPVARDTITGLTLAPGAFYANPKGPTATTATDTKKHTFGTIVRYRGSANATTTFIVLSKASGRKHGKICQKPSKANLKGKTCTYYVRVGSFTHKDAAGAVHFRFTGRVGGRTLKPGSYRLELVPRNGAGTGAAAIKAFTIKGTRPSRGR